MDTPGRIRDAALHHFSVNGYEGASLSAIANDAGIKKQSLYTHFENKDQLFIYLCCYVFENELKATTAKLRELEKSTMKKTLFALLRNMMERYETCDTTKFLVRMSMFPPLHLKETVTAHFYEYWDSLEALLGPVFRRGEVTGELAAGMDVDDSAYAFLGLMDSVYIEMLYGGKDRLQRRFRVSWDVYIKGISGQTDGGADVG